MRRLLSSFSTALLVVAGLTSLSQAQEGQEPPRGEPFDTVQTLVPETLRGSAQLAGQVVADETGEPLARALVVLQEAGTGTLTDDEGTFLFPELNPGRYSVQVLYLGRTSSPAEVELAAGETTRLELALGVEAVELPELEVTVTGRERRRGKLAGFYERMERGMGQYITRDEIEKHRGQRLSEVFRSVRGYRVVPCVQPDSRVPRVGCFMLESGRKTPSFMDATGPCTPIYYIDGARYSLAEPTGPDGAVAGLGLNDLGVEEVEAIEIYAGPASLPGQYMGSDAGCGVVLIWTR